MNINDMKYKAYLTAQKRKVYGKDPEAAIIDKLKEEVEELKNAFLKDSNPELNINLLKSYARNQEISFNAAFDVAVKNSKGDELADIIIVCLAAAVKLDIDIERHLELKLEYNEGRGD